MNDKKNSKEKEFSEKIYKWLLIILLVAIAIAVAVSVFVKRYASKQIEEEVTEEAPVQEETVSNVQVTEPEPEDEIEIPEKELDWDEIKAENEDIYAWIYVPGTEVDYPVLSSKDGVDKDFYLDHNLDGNYGPYPGCIYSQNEYNKTDFSDNNLILYGHNMKNGSMFASLHQYEDLVFFEENRYIYIYTPDQNYAYEIFAVYKTENYLIPETFDTTTEYGYAQYIDYIFGDYNAGMTSHYSEDVRPTTEDKIITLSTCVSGEKTNRWLVQGVRLN